MTDLEEQLRQLMRDATTASPPEPARTSILHRRIARRRRARVVGAAGLLAIALVGTSAGVLATRPAAHHTPTLARPTSPAAIHPPVKMSGAKNILLVGTDSRAGTSANDPSRADAITILHLPAGHDRGYLISIPRDTYVRIPAYNNGKHPYPGGQGKIDGVYALGAMGLTGAAARANGFQLLAMTIKAQYSITFDAAVIADFAGFQQVIDTLGGVTMNVDEKTTSVDIGFDQQGHQTAPFTMDSDGIPSPVPGVKPVVYQPGRQHLTASQALDYVRQRVLLADNDGDYGRQRHEQQLLIAVYQQVLSAGTLTNPRQFSSLLAQLGKAVTFDTGGISVADWAVAIARLGRDHLIGIRTNDGKYATSRVDGQDVELLNATSLQLLSAVRDDTVDQFIAAHPDWAIAS